MSEIYFTGARRSGDCRRGEWNVGGRPSSNFGTLGSSAEKIFDRAQKSSEDWKDWFLDWFRTSADVNGSLSTGFESLRVIRKPDNTVDRIVFTNLNASGSRSEAQESMTYQELVRLAGGEAEANYIITRTGG